VGFFKKKSEDEIAKTTPPLEVEVAPMPTGGRSPEQTRTAPEFQSPTQSAPLQSPPAQAEAGFDRFGKLRSALGPGTVIQGKLSFDTPVRIDGRLSGEIFSSQAIIVGSTGSIEGDIEVQSLVVLGLVRGKVRAQRVEVLQGGRLEADFIAPVLTIEEGGAFNGRASMGASAPISSPGASQISSQSAIHGPAIHGPAIHGPAIHGPATQGTGFLSSSTNLGAPSGRSSPAAAIEGGSKVGGTQFASEGSKTATDLNGTVQ
jgi:cytoskeletal protein CcmA (bactofilin family)